MDFNPRSPSRERHAPSLFPRLTFSISIHALQAESDKAQEAFEKLYGHISIHALQAESDAKIGPMFAVITEFQSTLSKQRATYTQHRQYVLYVISIHALQAESDSSKCSFLEKWKISIHALQAESDLSCKGLTQIGKYFNPRSPSRERRVKFRCVVAFKRISIHALQAESDSKQYAFSS